MNYHFAEELKAIREIAGYTQSEFAKLIHVEQATISRNEQCVTEPSSRLMERVYSYAFDKNIQINRLKEMLWRERILRYHQLLFHGAKS